ncbi:MAG TPA: transketolase C-terminal domain-containing protein [Candidatus Udaeobacter sp.]|nr:transketolase C-terminal domain-containing protein [Candidatus Udaeobacter sp.]
MSKSPLDAFISTLQELFASDPRLFLLAADQVGEARLGALFAAYPDRCRNLGTAERNLLGVAAGMAAAGKVVVAVLPGASAASRAGDILRNIIARSGLNVIVAALPAGVEGRAGSSSQALHDLAAMLAIPGLRVVAPADAKETSAALKALTGTPGPAYLRLIRGEVPVVTESAGAFELGPIRTLREGGIAFVTTGALAGEAMKAADLLAAESIDVRVVHVPTLKPFDGPAIRRMAREAGGLVVAEEHYLRGGLGALVAQEIALSRPMPIEFVAVDDRFLFGSEVADLRTAAGLRAANLVAAVKRLRERMR